MAPKTKPSRTAETAERRLELSRALVELLVGKLKYHHNFFLTDLFDMGLGVEDSSLVLAPEIRRRWSEYLSGSGRRHTLNLYIGMPYCRSRCGYCIYFKGVGKKADVERYKDRLAASIDYFAGVLKKARFDSVYFGGGTPSLFSEAQLRSVCRAFRRRVRFDPGGERSFECSPATTTREKLRIIADAGFNRVSFGVESLTPAALRGINRAYQTEKMVRDSIRWAKDAGFRYISADLMLGLRGDSGKSLESTFRRIFGFGPYAVRVYPCQPTPRYLEACFGGDRAAFKKHLERHVARLPRLVALAERAGFVVAGQKIGTDRRSASAITMMRKGSPSPSSSYHFNVLDRPASVLGLGHHSNSYIHDRLRYNSTPLHADPARNHYRAFGMDRRRAMAFFVLHDLGEERSLSRERFRARFGVDVLEVFGEEVSQLESLGRARVDARRVTLLPKKPRERFLHATFFLRHRDIAGKLNSLTEGNGFGLTVGGRRVEGRIVFNPEGVRPPFALELAEAPASPPAWGARRARVVKALRTVFERLNGSWEGLDLAAFRRRYLSEVRRLFGRSTKPA